MKIPPGIRPAITALAIGLTTFASTAQTDHSNLIEALLTKKKEATANFEEAEILMQGYQDYLDDPEIEAIEKLPLRKAFLEQKTRQTLSRNEIKRTDGALTSLVRLRKAGSVDAKAFKASYEGLEELSNQARDSWKEILSVRENLRSDLQAEYETKLLAAADTQQGLKTRETLSKLLLDSVDPRGGKLDNDQYKTALKLPLLIMATESGFGIEHQREDKERHAQLILFALTGYSNYFGDHFDGSHSAGETEFSEQGRNVFGVADGRVLLSDAISRHESNYYHLSDKSRARFNTRVQTIWGPGSLQVKTWNQQSSNAFVKACQKLAITSKNGTSQPNEAMVALIKKVDDLFKAEAEARQAIEMIHSEYQHKLAEAEAFGEDAWLSTAGYNASVWVKESKELLADFEQAEARLAKQNEDCTLPGWKPDTQGIQKSIRIIQRASQRYPSVAKVRRDLEEYFGEEKPEEEIVVPKEEEAPAPEPLPTDPASFNTAFKKGSSKVNS